MPSFQVKARGEFQGRWTQLMDQSMKDLFELGFKASDIEKTLQSIPVFESMLESARQAAARGATMAILSDANHMFIHAILAHHGMENTFSIIKTNTGLIDTEGCIHISPFHDSPIPHTCPLCPANLCKGSVFDTFRKPEHKRVVYIGDGGGDLCPAVRLQHTDWILARHDFALHKHIVANRDPVVQAQVYPWTSGGDVLRFFQEQVFAPSTSLNS
eukprot:c4641_g1_i1.p1 GENE.c4641_g1_i1~~c4641_g1_i1.p1  ORF type:complete len:215 (+),score=36.21 c4641_g1_i1:190-834(+)